MDEAWQRAVEAALGGEDPSSAQSLMLDGAIKCAQGRLPPRSLLEPLSQLRHLSIANTGISTLADFPRLPHLAQLVLSDNRIAGGLDHLVEAGLHSLRDLDLSNNKMQHLEDLSPLTRLNLVSLDLYECPVTRVPNYRAQVFGMIKSLKYLDKVDADNNERPESDDEESEEEDGEDANSEGVDEEDAAVVVGEQHANGRGVKEEDEEDEGGEGNEELDEEEEDEDGSYQEVVGVADVSAGAGQDEENGSDYEEVEDEDDEDGDNVVEVHDVHESEEELAAEDEDEDDDGEDEEELLEQGPGSASGPPEGELEVQEEDENGELGEDEEDEEEEDEEDEDDEDVAVEEVEEDYGTDYLVQPIMQQEEDEGASDFEPGEGEEEDEEIEDDVEEEHPAAQAAGSAAAGSTAAAAAASRKKRSRDEEEIVDTREMSSDRPHKR